MTNDEIFDTAAQDSVALPQTKSNNPTKSRKPKPARKASSSAKDKIPGVEVVPEIPAEAINIRPDVVSPMRLPARQKPAAKKQANKAKPKDPPKIAPSLEEVTAFISSLKKDKGQLKNASMIVSEPEEVFTEAEPSDDSVISEAQDSTGAPQISRREKRRIEWIEKRRQWRDQKKLERDQRRAEYDSTHPPINDNAAISENGQEATRLDDVQEHPSRPQLLQKQPSQQQPSGSQPSQKQQSQQQASQQQVSQQQPSQQKESQQQASQQQTSQRQPSKQQPSQKQPPQRQPQAIQTPRVEAVANIDDHSQIEKLSTPDVPWEESPGRNSRGKRGKKKPHPEHDSASQPGIAGQAKQMSAAADTTSAKNAKPGTGTTPAAKETSVTTAASQAKGSDVQSPANRDDKKKKQSPSVKVIEAEKTGGEVARPLEPAAKSEARPKDKKKEKPEKIQPVQVADAMPPPLPEAKRLVHPPKQYFVYKDITKKPELSDEVAYFVERVESYMHTEFLSEDGSSIMVCVSGGVDSIVLLDILHILSFEHAFTLTVVHVNHGLRGADAKRDEKFVRLLAQKYDLQCHSTQVKVDEFAKKHSLSEEEAARELRYKFFRQTASTVRAQFCAMAHNADDAAETLLMNLFRGTGLTGLSSIPPRRALVKKTQLIRPLLILSKQEILEYAALRELEWYEDETNTLTKYTRNKVRHDLLPKLKEDYNPKIIESLNRTASLLRKADGFIESLIHATYHSIVEEREDVFGIDVHKLEALHSFVQGEIVERAIAQLTFDKPVSFAAVDRVLSLINKKAGARETIINNLIALRDRDEIVLMYEQHLQEVFLTIYKLGEYSIGKYSITLEEVHRNDVRIGLDKMVEYLDYDRLPYRLTLRTWHPGDSFHPIGLEGHVKVSDLLTNEKVEHAERQNALVLATATDIVWVCGLRMSDEFKITNETRRIVRATFKRSDVRH